MEILDLRRQLRVQRREMLCNTQRDAKAYRINCLALENKSAWFMETSNIRNCVTRNVKLLSCRLG